MEILDDDDTGVADLDKEFAQVSQEVKPQVEDELPEKYRGKTAYEIAKMHQEAEKTIGRQGQEVSEVRRLADQLIQQSFQKTARVEQPEPKDDLDDVDFFADPKSAINKAVSNHPAVINAQQAQVNMQRQEALRNLRDQHPDYKEAAAEQGFQEWVSKSRVRQQLFMAADRNYDFDAANELLTTYKELKARREDQQTQEVSTLRTGQDAALKAASNPALGGSSEPTGKKIYRRSDLIKLRIEKPDVYEAREAEIMAAYAENRVR